MFTYFGALVHTRTGYLAVKRRTEVQPRGTIYRFALVITSTGALVRPTLPVRSKYKYPLTKETYKAFSPLMICSLNNTLGT